MSFAARIGGGTLLPAGPPFVRRAAAPSVSERCGEAGPSGLSITLDHVTRAFGERVVLDGLSLQIPAGQAVAVVGRSGGGKSTLLRLLMGLDRPTSGVIEIEGAQIRGLQPAVRLMFQEPRLLPWQTVLGNVGLGRGANWRARARAALESVGLADRAHEWPSVLSGGQRQRVALARALVDRPGLLLLDEPFSALDALTRAEMHKLLVGLWEARGFTAVLITHDVGEAIALADRVLVLREGRLSLDLPIPIDRAARDLHGAAAADLRTRIMAAV